MKLGLNVFLKYSYCSCALSNGRKHALRMSSPNHCSAQSHSYEARGNMLPMYWGQLIILTGVSYIASQDWACPD